MQRPLRAATVAPHAIIVDLALPAIDGLEVCRRLRRHGNRTPILMLTARHAVEARVEGLEVRADASLVKPYDVRELQARLRAIVRRHVAVGLGMIGYFVNRAKLTDQVRTQLQQRATALLTSGTDHGNSWLMALGSRSPRRQRHRVRMRGT